MATRRVATPGVSVMVRCPPWSVAPVYRLARAWEPGRDANVNRLLKACYLQPTVPELVARRAADLRTRARRGSAVDAVVVAVAEPGGTVLTGDGADLRALAANAVYVVVETI